MKTRKISFVTAAVAFILAVAFITGNAYAWEMDTDLSNADASFWGEGAGDYAGYSVFDAGDVNGDGYGDILIGAPYDDDGGTDAGQAYLILGKSTGWSMDTDLSDADASFRGEDSYDRAGCSVSGAGDVNDDGYGDILIGAYGDEEGGGSYAGQVYLILGKSTGWEVDTDLSNADASFRGEDSSDDAGYSVSGAGDVNNDGYDDILIGAIGDEEGGGGFAGQVYLILGKNSDWGMDTDLSDADASFCGEDAGDFAGFSVSCAGDVNGDGYDDILIGAPWDDDGGGSAGQAYLILGKSSGWSMDTDLSDADASFCGEDADDRAGYSVSGAGDVNDDGYDDILIGAPYDEEGGSYAGQVYLMLGTPPTKPSYVVSSDASGTERNTFDLSENVYCYAGNLPKNTEVKIYVVDNKDDWKIGDPLTDVSGGVELVTTNSSGGIWPPVNIWSSPLIVGKYDIVVDIDNYGYLDEGEPIDSWATTGFEAIPEFTTIAIPVTAILGLLFLFSRRRNKEE
jgi:hypothetical protein